MAKGYLYSGAKWGHLKCQEVKSGFLTAGNATDGFRSRLAVTYELLCSCGKQISVRATQFPGKRLMRDCGCGVADEDYRSVNIKASVPLRIYDMVRAYVDVEGGMTMGHAITKLIEMGWATYLEGAKTIESTDTTEPEFEPDVND